MRDPLGFKTPREKGPEDPGADGGGAPGAPSAKPPGHGLNGGGDGAEVFTISPLPGQRPKLPPGRAGKCPEAPWGCGGEAAGGDSGDSPGTRSRGAGDAPGPAVTLSGSRSEAVPPWSRPQSTAELLRSRDQRFWWFGSGGLEGEGFFPARFGGAGEEVVASERLCHIGDTATAAPGSCHQRWGHGQHSLTGLFSAPTVG